MSALDGSLYSDHELWKQLERLESKARDLYEEARIGANRRLSVDEDDAGRILHGVLYSVRHLRTIDPEFLWDQQLDDLNAACATVLSSLNQIMQHPPRSSLAQIQTNLGDLIGHVARVPIVRTADDVGDLRSAAANFRRSLSQHRLNAETELNRVQSEAQVTSAEIASLQAEVETERGRYRALVDGFEASHREALERAEENSAVRLKDLDEEVQSQLRELQASMLEAQEQRITEHGERFNTFLDEARSKATETQEDLSTEADAVISDLHARLEEAKEIVGLVGLVGMTGNYKNSADVEALTADRWRIGGFCLGLAGVALTVVLFFQGSSDWSIAEVIRRVFLSLVPFGIASYALQQAASHREQQRLNRRMQLELTSLLPYLSQLPPKQANALKVSLAPRYFPGHALTRDFEAIDLTVATQSDDQDSTRND